MSPSPTPPKRLDCHSDIFQLQCGLRCRDAHHDCALHASNSCNGSSSDKGKKKSLSSLNFVKEGVFKNRIMKWNIIETPVIDLYYFCLSSRCTGCIEAEAEACSELRRSGAPECGKVLQFEKPGSKLLPTQPRVQVCPSTPPQCQVTLTTVTGSNMEWPLGGDR